MIFKKRSEGNSGANSENLVRDDSRQVVMAVNVSTAGSNNACGPYECTAHWHFGKMSLGCGLFSSRPSL